MINKQMWAAIIGSLVILEVLSLSTTASAWPWGVLSHEKLGLRILGWYLVAQGGLAFLSLVFSGIVLGEKRCLICGHDLRTFFQVYGGLAMCPRCRTMFHKNCLAAKNGRCPVCNPEFIDDSDILIDYRKIIGHGPRPGDDPWRS